MRDDLAEAVEMIKAADRFLSPVKMGDRPSYVLALLDLRDAVRKLEDAYETISGEYETTR